MSEYDRYYASLTKAVENSLDGLEQLAQVVRTLHGEQGTAAAETVMEVIARGFGYPLRGSTLTFAGLCRASDNPAALRAVLKAAIAM